MKPPGQGGFFTLSPSPISFEITTIAQNLSIIYTDNDNICGLFTTGFL
jgi:hypothetical protein